MYDRCGIYDEKDDDGREAVIGKKIRTGWDLSESFLRF